MFASGSIDTTIVIWQTSPLVNLFTLTNNTSPVNSLVFLSSLNYLISASSDGVINVWQIFNASYTPLMINKLKYSSSVKCLAELTSGLIAAGSSDNKINIWNVTSGLLLVNLSGHTQPVISLAYLPNTCLASGSADHLIKVLIYNRAISELFFFFLIISKCNNT